MAIVLTLLSPGTAKGAVEQIAWPTVLLVCGIVLYVSLMETIGTIDWLGEEVATIGAPLLAALIICFIGGAVSAFASTTGILGALIPLAVPFLTGDQRDRCGRAHHRTGDLVVRGRLQPVLDQWRADRCQHTGRAPGRRLQGPHAVGLQHGPDRTDRDVGALRTTRLAVTARGIVAAST